MYKVKIAELRKYRGLTQRDLAKKLGVDHSAIAKWESCANNISTKNIRRCARFFSVRIDELFEIDNSTNYLSNKKNHN